MILKTSPGYTVNQPPSPLPAKGEVPGKAEFLIIQGLHPTLQVK